METHSSMALARIDEVAAARAEHYALLAALLAEPPSDALLHEAKALAAHYGGARSETTRLTAAWQGLASALSSYSPEAWREEYEALFYGISRPEVIPYGSFYLAGFMMEEPLAELRAWWAENGLYRRAEVSEPEDHIAAELEVMRHLAARGDEEAECHFFSRFLWPWAGQFASALGAATGAAAYRAVAELLDAFLTLEAFYWELEV